MNKLFADYLKSPGVSATALLVGLIDEYGTELFEWDPETLRLEIKSDYGVAISQDNMDKVQALITVLTTDMYYRNLEAFMHVTNALSHNGANFQAYDPPDVQEISWALAETALIDPPDKGTTFGPEIVSYMLERLKYEGFTKAPKIMAAFSGEPAVEEEVNSGLGDDEVVYHSYWDGQQRKRLDVEAYIRDGLRRIMLEVTALPLKSADPKALQELKGRVDRAAAKQARETSKGLESVPRQPQL
jgi:hypothetical protein